MQEAREVERANAQLMSEAQAQHAALCAQTERHNADVLGGARKDWEADCEEVRGQHAAATGLAQAAFEDQRDLVTSANESLLEQRQAAWRAAVEDAEKMHAAACIASCSAHKDAEAKAREHNERIMPAVRRLCGLPTLRKCTYDLTESRIRHKMHVLVSSLWQRGCVYNEQYH
jgi:hypothetical protein